MHETRHIGAGAWNEILARVWGPDVSGNRRRHPTSRRVLYRVILASRCLVALISCYYLWRTNVMLLFIQKVFHEESEGLSLDTVICVQRDSGSCSPIKISLIWCPYSMFAHRPPSRWTLPCQGIGVVLW